MLQVGIVGLQKYKIYADTLLKSDKFNIVGLFDPSLNIQKSDIEIPHFNFDDLLNNCDIIIFTTPNKLFYPLIIKALQSFKHIILDNIYQYNTEQINSLSNTAKEACTNIFVIHKQKYNELIELHQSIKTKTLLIDDTVELKDNTHLLQKMNEEVSLCLHLINNNIRKIRTNIFSVNSQVPDLYYTSLEFDNGCVCNISVGAFNNADNHSIRIIGQNTLSKINFQKLSAEISINNKHTKHKFTKQDNNDNSLILKQINDIYLQIKDNNTDYYPLSKEIQTINVLSKITEQLKRYNKLF